MKDAFSQHPQVNNPRFVKQMQDAIPTLPEQEARVAQYMLLNADYLGFETGASIAKKAGTSEVTVGRLLRRMGYRGMAGLKQEIKAGHASDNLNVEGQSSTTELDSQMKDALDSEIHSLVNVFRQVSSPLWGTIIQTLLDADIIYVSGFQTIRGVAEDFSKRLSLARDNVRYISAHDGMLCEWISNSNSAPKHRLKECQIIIDIVPYARESEVLSSLCLEHGRDLVIVSDEFCHWASDYTEMIVHAPSKNGLLLESTGALVTALNLMIHGVAKNDEKAMKRRLETWQSMTRKLKVF